MSRTSVIDLDVEPGRIERAELHVVIWDGGAGQVKDCFTLNGPPLTHYPAGRSFDKSHSRL